MSRLLPNLTEQVWGQVQTKNPNKKRWRDAFTEVKKKLYITTWLSWNRSRGLRIMCIISAGSQGRSNKKQDTYQLADLWISDIVHLPTERGQGYSLESHWLFPSIFLFGQRNSESTFFQQSVGSVSYIIHTSIFSLSHTLGPDLVTWPCEDPILALVSQIDKVNSIKL